jgi:3-oxoacyl-[acyl-carrier protein] reductase/meso-butanediol dehydrogenase/(S,S)-butanediol dehydrogenase/diacetyl reductase
MSSQRATIVTGGSSGIGAAIATAFYSAGDHVVIGARNDNGFAQKLGNRAKFVKTDVSKPSELHILVQTAKQWTGRMDVMINNAGFMAGKRGTPNNSVYCAAKFGVNGVTQALAKELGPRGIRVNAVCPVLVVTDGLINALQQEYAPAHGKTVEEFLEAFTKANSALGRLPGADDVAQLCLYLASPAASAITGQCPNVDCGVFPQ